MTDKFDDIDFDYGINKCNEALRNDCVMDGYPMTPSQIRDIREILGMLRARNNISPEDAIRFKDYFPVSFMLTDRYWVWIRDCLDSFIVDRDDQ